MPNGQARTREQTKNQLTKKPLVELAEVQLVATKSEYVSFSLFCFTGIAGILYLFLWEHLIDWVTIAALYIGIGGVIYSVRKLYQDHPEYIVDEQGIQFSPDLGGYLIPWTDIEAIRDERQIEGPDYIQLRLKADSAYWTSLSPLRKQLLRLHACGRDFHPAVRLHTAGLVLSHQTIFTMIHRYFQTYHAARDWA